MPLASPVRVTNPAVRSIVWPRGSTTSAGSGTSLLVITEEILHEQEARRCQPPAGPVPALEDAKNPYRGEPPAGPANRAYRLDRARGARRGDSPEQGEERGRATTAHANKSRCDDAESNARYDLARVGGPSSPLRPGQIPVRADRDGLDAGLHDGARLRGAVGRGWGEVDQRVRGGVGSRREVSGPKRGSGGHDSAGGSHPIPERDGIDGRLRDICGGSKQESWAGVQEIRFDGGEPGEG